MADAFEVHYIADWADISSEYPKLHILTTSGRVLSVLAELSDLFDLVIFRELRVPFDLVLVPVCGAWNEHHFHYVRNSRSSRIQCSILLPGLSRSN
uniref:p10 n=1 Tax=Muscovy duck reovirus TaxID=77153 RepID=A5JM15_9REOV|nr:P10 [Muscovy duck reovirus]